MSVIYLYLKIHNKTGLKYLGKTNSKEPSKYEGSGLYWTRHIAKHGYDVTTEILAKCHTNDEVSKIGRYYSEKWNVVNSKEFANLKEERGDGGWDYINQNEELRKEKNRKAAAAANRNGSAFKIFKQKEYEKSPKFCGCCDKKLPYEKRMNRYCNRSCAVTVNNKLFPKRKKISETKLVKG